MKKIQVERFNKDMALIFRMPPQQLKEQFIKFEQDTNDFINEATKESIQESIQKSMHLKSSIRLLEQYAPFGL